MAPGRVTAIDSAVAPLDEARAAAEAAGVQVDVREGDAYAIDLPDDSVDVVHAHQVLQHVADPVAVLREMARVCRPGGIIAARDADYAAMTWAPADPLLDRWLEIYRDVARSNSAEPDAGRALLGWAHAAGLADVTATASTWCFATPEDRRWWGSLWADRTAGTSYAQQAVAAGLERPGRARGDRGSLALVGRAAGRLVGRRARRDPLPRVTRLVGRRVAARWNPWFTEWK